MMTGYQIERLALMTYNEVKLIVELVSIAAGITGICFVRSIEKRLGCKNDWELIALGWRKINTLWQTGAKQGKHDNR